MDSQWLKGKLEGKFGGAILDVGRFGRSEIPCVWVESRRWREVALFCRDEATLMFDWVENMNVLQVDATLVVSCFFHRRKDNERLVARLSAPLRSGGNKRVEVPSLKDIFPSAFSFEVEAVNLFGVYFSEVAPDRAFPPHSAGVS